jgi:hypothetical protein
MSKPNKAKTGDVPRISFGDCMEYIQKCSKEELSMIMAASQARYYGLASVPSDTTPPIGGRGRGRGANPGRNPESRKKDPRFRKEKGGALSAPREVTSLLEVYLKRKAEIEKALPPEKQKSFKASEAPELADLYSSYEKKRKEWLASKDPPPSTVSPRKQGEEPQREWADSDPAPEKGHSGEVITSPPNPLAKRPQTSSLPTPKGPPPVKDGGTEGEGEKKV